MPKLKTHRGAAKRLRLTGTGKIARVRAFKRHKLGKKTAKRKRRLGQSTLVHRADSKRMRRLIPHM